MRFVILLFFLTVLCSQLLAQKKTLTYQQVFDFGQPQLLGLLPQLKGWLDDESARVKMMSHRRIAKNAEGSFLAFR